MKATTLPFPLPFPPGPPPPGPSPNPAVINPANPSVLVPITTAVSPGARETGVPETAIAPPAVSVWESMIYCPSLFAVMIWEPIVMSGASVPPAPPPGPFPNPAVVNPAKPSVLVPITTCVYPGASEIGVPETVIAPPAVSV